jgi:hypothetical protein
MLGDFRTGKTLGRDGGTELGDFSVLGNKWQVFLDENMLFYDICKPSFPEKCIVPEEPRGERRRRRLGESLITKSKRRLPGCAASIDDPVDCKDCLVTQDMGYGWSVIGCWHWIIAHYSNGRESIAKK